ncbi:MAG: asparaginase [Euryarchaeota archaeon]|nr:asparaginase [Euryarchaeota archaeon]
MNKESFFENAMIICHGGAGHGAKDQPGVDVATEAGKKILMGGGTSVDAVLKAVEIMENDPNLNAGTGGCIRADGSVQLDAIIATGDRKMGGVIAIEDCKNPIKVAAKLLNEPINLLAGRGASEFAVREGFLLEQVIGRIRKNANDTVGALAIDKNGLIAAASSTGGCSGRPAGRVGDTPLWGPGIWCEEDIAVIATGIGEEITLEMICYRVAQKVKKSGMNLEDALDWGLSQFEKSIDVGLLIINSKGDALGKSNTKMPWKKL